MPRREHDFYPTPSWATQQLLRRIDIRGVVLEPCVGAGDIANVLAVDSRIEALSTNDVDHGRTADSHRNAADPGWWSSLEPVDYVVTNPPFLLAHKILPLAWRHARIGVSMLLRLTYLEPCEGRASWLVEYPPHKLIVLPRMSFTGDGKTDSVTCAWMVWDRYCCGQAIEIVPSTPDGQLSMLEVGA